MSLSFLSQTIISFIYLYNFFFVLRKTYYTLFFDNKSNKTNDKIKYRHRIIILKKLFTVK